MVPMKIEMHYYDVYPKVVIENDPVTVTIRPLGWHAGFVQGTAYRVVLQPRNDRDYPTCTEHRVSRAVELSLTPDGDGCLRFTHTFWGEQPWFIIIFDPGQEKFRVRLSLFSLHEDMRGRYPYLGDLHVHSRCSDGREAPAVVAANLRKAGYDFTVISDHHRYYGSLEAIRAYKDVKIDMNIVPGEECHLPDNMVHIVNFGGLWSVNSQVDSCKALAEKGTSPEFRALDGKTCPPILPVEEYRRQVMVIVERLGELPPDVDPFTYAACLWVYDHIREADGLAIFAHPYWISGSALNVPEPMMDYMFRTHPFDAFELLGGERYLDHNEFQVFKYEKMRAEGVDFPVVGSSDSHGSTECNPNWNIGQTIVFAHKNERRELIDSIKAQYSVAVDRISPEYRLAGDFRFVQFGRFLMDFYFPLHDELCFEEGRLMKAHVCGQDADAADQLARLQGRCARLFDKYFAY